MNEKTINVAGESLQELEAALDCYDITFEECGCVNMSGTLPPHLGQVLKRALNTIEAQVAADNPDTWREDAELQPIRQLFLRIGAAYAEHG